MNDEPTLEHIFSTGSPQADIVFVHGLTGNSQATWTNRDGKEFWPLWLKSELDNVSVYTLSYPASLFEKWAKREMPMFERSGNTLEQFAFQGIGQRPIIFVTHSLGGILTKMILRKSLETDNEDWKKVANVTKLVVFLSTPHTGTALASILDVVPQTSTHIKLLKNDSGFLDDLNSHYRSFANNTDGLSTVVYYEKHATKGTVVCVSRDSADPGVAKAEPIAFDKDHLNICKPTNPDDVVYQGIKYHIQKVLTALASHNSMSEHPPLLDDYEKKSIDDRRDLLQKLIDAGREREYNYANNAQNHFARRYTKTGLFSAARDDHDNLLSEIETRFVTHVDHPLICQSASDDDIRKALQECVIDSLTSRTIGDSRFTSKVILSGLYYLTEQCYIRWDPPA